MRYKLPVVIVITFICCSCSKKHDTPSPVFAFNNMDSVNMLFSIDHEFHASESVIAGTAHFVYSGERVTNRFGGYMSIATSTGFGGVYTTGIYDTIEYINNETIWLITKDSLPFLDVYPLKREITLQNGRIARKVTTGNTTTSLPDTIWYFYDNQNRLNKTVQHFGSKITTRDYLYDDIGNLQKITEGSQWNGGSIVFGQTEELFGGYDNKPNPLKGGLCLWQDLLYITLSTNNFTTYSYRSSSGYETRNFNLFYDANGNVDYSK